MTRQEFENDLLDKKITRKYLKKSNNELLEMFGDEFMKTVNYGKQNNQSNCYELFEHILRTVANVSDEYLDEESFKKVKIAAFFHDIGKPYVAQLNEKTGQTQYIGHAKKSAEIAKDILEKIGYSEQEISELLFLIESHDDFIQISKMEDITVEKIGKILETRIKKTEGYEPNINDYIKLISLCKADIMSQSDVIRKDGEIVDTMEDRIKRLENIKEILPKAIIYRQENELAKLEKQKSDLVNGPSPIEKGGKIVNQKQIDIWNSITQEEKDAKLQEIDGRINTIKAEEKHLLGEDERKKQGEEKYSITKEDARKLVQLTISEIGGSGANDCLEDFILALYENNILFDAELKESKYEHFVAGYSDKIAIKFNDEKGVICDVFTVPSDCGESDIVTIEDEEGNELVELAYVDQLDNQEEYEQKLENAIKQIKQFDVENKEYLSERIIKQYITHKQKAENLEITLQENQRLSNILKAIERRNMLRKGE